MASWIIVPCLVKLREEFNLIAPGRDKASDGGIGDSAHQANSSDHNDDEIGNVPIRDADKLHEVHAIDVDVDLRTPGVSMEKAVQHILARCRKGTERRLRYIIFNRRIWSANGGWRQERYTGANPHDHHAHFSASYNTVREASRASWRLADLLPQPDPSEGVNMTTPSEAADAVAGRDIDPSANRYSWAGADWTTFNRTARIGPMADLVEELDARVEDVQDDMDGVMAALIVIQATQQEVLKRLPAEQPPAPGQ